MYAYCNNDPVSNIDPTGNIVISYHQVKQHGMSVAIKKVSGFFTKTFGAGATVVEQHKQEMEYSPFPLNMLITVKTGTKESFTISSVGN